MPVFLGSHARAPFLLQVVDVLLKARKRRRFVGGLRLSVGNGVQELGARRFGRRCVAHGVWRLADGKKMR